MIQIARCDWLPERARWSHLARSGLPAVSRKQNFAKSHIINPLLTKFVRSRWLDIGLVLFLASLWTSTSSRSINSQKTVRAIDNFVYMMTWRPGTILKKLYSPQNFVPAFLSTVVWSLESQSPGKRTDRASIQSNQKWRRIKCVEEFCIRSRTAAPKWSSDSLTCYEAKGNLR